MKSLIKALLKEKKLTKRKIEFLKKQYAENNKLNSLPLSSDILMYAKKHASKSDYEELRKVLVTKPTRTLSGVAVIAVMAKPAPCPGKCIYCPVGANAPQSYTGYEPATMRAIANDYNPYKQVKNRLKQLQDVGHSTEKCELIIMGGTFPSLDWKYQKHFVKRCFDAFNGKTSKNLADAQRINETAKNRVIGLTIETRQDYVFPKKLLELGATRVELGIQSVYDDVLSKVSRGHTVKDSVDAIRKLKENGFKILYQVMLGLPGSSLKKDIAMFKILFTDERFRPDMLKIYPTLVIKNTVLYNLWKTGRYTAIDEKYVLKVLKKVYEMCPPEVRIHRIQRDIPREHIIAGPTQSNLREVITKSKGFKTLEIRYREVGHAKLHKKTPLNEEIIVRKYKAQGGDEYFISAEDKKQNILLGFCRLRIAVSKKAFVRELHVYGRTLPIKSKTTGVQHSGLGKQLMKKAEEIAKSAGVKDIYVISGVGVRDYYRNKLGYKLKQGYMWKSL